MKLGSRITLSLSIVLTFIMTIWAVVFYFEMISEINDETDDALENHAKLLMTQFLSGDHFAPGDRDNYAFDFDTVTATYANAHLQPFYVDTMMYIASAMEREPARILTTVFKNADNQYFELSVAAPTVEKQDLREAILFWTIFLYVLLLIVIICVNILIYRHQLRPFYKTLDWLSHYRVGESMPTELGYTHTIEFDRLNEEITKHVSRTEKTFQEQRIFLSQASHELQTPIAVCLNRIELLLNDGTLSEKQIEEWMKIQHTLVQLKKLNKSLLFLSRIQNQQFIETKPVILNDYIHTMLPDFEEMFAHLNLHILFTEKGQWTLEMNETLAQSLITNLIKNAFVHNREEGTLKMEIDNRHFRISNSGQPEALATDKIFNCYYHDSGNPESTGLGLAIVFAIAERYQLAIDYQFVDDLHVFDLHLVE